MTDFPTRKMFFPTRIFVEEIIENTKFAQKLLRQFSDLPTERIRDANKLLDNAAAEGRQNSWQGTILLAKQRGPFLRYCPGTQNHICCMYHNLDVAAGCDLDCSYCILQGYLNNPLKTFYCNLDDMTTELDHALLDHANRFYRIGTGELSDSLTFDHFTHLDANLVRYFADKKNAIIELKSKNVNIEELLGLAHNRRTVISWSLNAQAMAEREEPDAPSLDDRLAAAKEVQRAGYLLGFHFDPMIDHQGWEQGYKETVDKIFTFAKPENIAWISLGALRYPAGFDQVIRENHPDSNIVLGEFFPGLDKKLRYFMPIRVEMFRKMYQWIKSYSQNVLVYLCMENDEVWRKSFGWSPGSSARLKKMLDDRVK